ncbi:MAG: apolipoprotein N-acyltransferase [Lentisphaeria bacterium]|jgi:apolipoprotein N-acyltransferase
MLSPWQTLGWRGGIAALFAGALTTYSMAPYNVWPLGIIAALTLACLLQDLNAKQGLIRSCIFGIGMFGSGASWVYVSIHDFGYTSAPLAALLTSIFVIGLGLVFSLPFYFYCRFLSRHRLGFILGFSAIWVLGEWSRSWFLTGFPWLYLGYGHTQTWLAGWAPVFGVFGISFFCVLSATLTSELIYETIRIFNPGKRPHALYPISFAALLATIWLSGWQLKDNNWGTHSVGEPVAVAIVQPNIPLELKWNPFYQTNILEILREQSDKHWDKQLIIWPEAAVPLMFSDAEEFIADITSQANASDTAVLTGILYDDAKPNVFYNSIIGMGKADGIYFKQRLVPFGEYVPLERWLRGIIAFFDLPNSIIFAGPSQQDLLHFGEYRISPSICYEIVYPDLVAAGAARAELLVTISNDAWFGDSIGPLQHFQMAQMRAIENRRYMIRATNTGLSGIITPHGQVSLLGTQFNRETISEQVSLIEGTTPFTRWGSLPIVVFCLFSVIAIFIASIKKQRNANAAKQ